METSGRTVNIDGEKLNQLWAHSDMSQPAFAKLAGITKGGLYRLMRPGVQRMFSDNFRELAKSLNITTLELRQRIGSDPPFEAIGKPPSGMLGPIQELVPLRVYHGVSAGARNERLAIEHGRLRLPDGLAEFAVRVDGESMQPDYPNHSLALFESVDGMQFSYEKDYLIWFDNNECYFSMVMPTETDFDQLLLRKRNLNKNLYPDRYVHRSEVTRIARCVGVVICKT